MVKSASEKITIRVAPVSGTSRWEVVEDHERRSGNSVDRWSVSLGKWATRSIADRKAAEAAR